jgi:hypothetical protein
MAKNHADRITRLGLIAAERIGADGRRAAGRGAGFFHGLRVGYATGKNGDNGQEKYGQNGSSHKFIGRTFWEQKPKLQSSFYFQENCGQTPETGFQSAPRLADIGQRVGSSSFLTRLV